ncbi:MAG: hypothetical protein L6R48_01065 [Planctomycetes bacterium]|nr:hypothetical protein [Planctomycetota bacterium]
MRSLLLLASIGILASDEGAWQPIGPGFEPGTAIAYQVRCDAADERRLWCATRPFGVWSSGDGGVTWTRHGAPPTDADGAVGVNNGMVQDSSTPGRWLLGYERSGVWISADDCRTWTASNAGIRRGRGMNAVSLALDPQDPRRALLGTDGGLYASDDGGRRWKRVTAGLPTGTTASAGTDVSLTITAIVHDPHRRGRIHIAVYATGEGERAGVFRSDDRGLTWQRTSDGIDRASVDYSGMPLQGDMAFALDVDRYHQGGLVVQTASGIYRSDNAGESWIRIRAGGGTGPVVWDRAKPDRIWLASDDGVWISDDRGAGWRQASTGLPLGRRPGAVPLRVPLIAQDGTTRVIEVWPLRDVYSGRSFAQAGSWMYLAWTDGVYRRRVSP